MESMLFGKTRDGEPVHRYTLSEPGGLSLSVSDYGCRILRLETPDREGKPGNVVLSYGCFAPYERDAKYAGAMVGRVANLICGAAFEMDGVTYRLSENEPPNHSHGGIHSFSNTVWEVRSYSDREIVFARRFADGCDGYPGNLSVTVTYSISGMDLKIVCQAVSDRKTPVSFTNHAYFNLDADLRRDISHYRLRIDAGQYLELSEAAVPTGRILPVDGTLLDFRTERTLSGWEKPFLAATRGYDHTLLLHGSGLRPAAWAHSPSSGRRLTVWTDLPALQLYTSNYPEPGLLLEGGVPDEAHHALCLETQYGVDFPNHPSFPGKYLLPGEAYTTTTLYRFDVL